MAGKAAISSVGGHDLAVETIMTRPYAGWNNWAEGECDTGANK